MPRGNWTITKDVMIEKPLKYKRVEEKKCRKKRYYVVFASNSFEQKMIKLEQKLTFHTSH